MASNAVSLSLFYNSEGHTSSDPFVQTITFLGFWDEILQKGLSKIGRKVVQMASNASSLFNFLLYNTEGPLSPSDTPVQTTTFLGEILQ